MSNRELAKHLNVPEATLRRWRNRLSSSHDADRVRVVRRGETTYSIRTDNIGAHGIRQRLKSRAELREELSQMKDASTPDVRRLLAVFGNWALGAVDKHNCLAAIEQLVRELTNGAANSPPLELE